MPKRSKPTDYQRAQAKIAADFAKRRQRLHLNTQIKLESLKAQKAAIRRSATYKAARKKAASYHTSRRRLAALAKVEKRFLGPLEARAEKIRANRIIMREALAEDRKAAAASLRRAYAAREKARREVQARLTKPLKKQPMRPFKETKRAGFERTAKSLKRRIAERTAAQKLTVPHRLPATKAGWRAYIQLMRAGCSSRKVQSFHTLIFVNGVSKVFDPSNGENSHFGGSRDICDPNMWFTLEEWMSARDMVFDVSDLPSNRQGALSGSDRNIAVHVEEYRKRHKGRNPTVYLIVRLQLGRPF